MSTNSCGGNLEVDSFTMDVIGDDCDKFYDVAQDVIDSMAVPSEMLGTPESSTATEIDIHYCPHGDCGWCYYRGEGETNAEGSACNSPQTCKVNVDGK